MKKFSFLFLFLFFCFGAIAFTPTPTSACIDTTTAIVGKVKNSIRLIYTNKRPSIHMCFIPTIDDGKEVGIKYFGIRVPGIFRPTANQPHKVIHLSRNPLHLRHGLAGKVIAFDYRQDRMYCAILHPLYSWAIYKENARTKEYRKIKLNPKKALLEFYKELLRNKEHKAQLANAARMLQRPGATVGSEYFTGRSGAKGMGCGMSKVPWGMKKKKKLPPKPKARVEDFE